MGITTGRASETQAGLFAALCSGFWRKTDKSLLYKNVPFLVSRISLLVTSMLGEEEFLVNK